MNVEAIAADEQTGESAPPTHGGEPIHEEKLPQFLTGLGDVHVRRNAADRWCVREIEAPVHRPEEVRAPEAHVAIPVGKQTAEQPARLDSVGRLATGQGGVRSARPASR